MTNPLYSHATGAPVSQTRGTSSTVRAEFDLVASAFDAVSNSVAGFATESGSLNNFVLTLTPQPAAYPTKGTAFFVATHANTGAATLQIGALAALPLLSNDGSPLSANYISNGEIVMVYINGTNAYVLGATKSYVDNTAFSSSVPAQGGNAGKVLLTNGTTAFWGSSSTLWSVGAGSVAAPSFNLGDPATGFYRTDFNQVALAINGVIAELDQSSGKTLSGNLVFGSGITFPANMSQAQAQAAIGAPSTTGVGASGTNWGISITGNAATATNITGGTVAILNGGTGATTAATALASLGGVSPATLNSGTLPVSATTLSSSGAGGQTYLGDKYIQFYNAGVLPGLIKSADDSSAFTSISVSKAASSLWANNAKVAEATATGLAVTGALSATGSLTTASIKEDVAGNIGLGGVTPSAWSGGIALELSSAISFGQRYGTELNITNNTYYATGGWTYKSSSVPPMLYKASGGTYSWYSAPSGTAGNLIPWNQVMTLDANGKLSISASGAIWHLNTFETNTANYSNTAGANAGSTCVKLGAMTTLRSLSAAGTLNTSGADYAEYERNNGMTITKGSIIGFKADGTLTDVFADATRFAIKSTNPSYVGGDTWGSEDQVGKRPEEPQRIADKTEQREVTQAITAVASIEGKTGVVASPAEYATVLTPEVVLIDGAETTIEHSSLVETKAAVLAQQTVEAVAAIEAVEATFETVILEAGDTDAQWATKQADYTAAKTAFEATLEAARQLVDRIAYSGKVPCNVMGAVPGGYIIAVEAPDGSIDGLPVACPSFDQYLKAVGRVNKIIDEAHAQRLAKQINVADWNQFVGRCEVAVIIH